jgi:hypothetical protein
MNAKKASVTAEEVRVAAKDAREKLLAMQKDIQALLTGLDGVVRDDANFSTRDAINTLLREVEDSNPKEVLKTLAKIHSARLLTRAKEA